MAEQFNKDISLSTKKQYFFGAALPTSADEVTPSDTSYLEQYGVLTCNSGTGGEVQVDLAENGETVILTFGDNRLTQPPCIVRRVYTTNTTATSMYVWY